MLTTRLLRSARPLSRLLYRYPTAPQRSSLSLIRLGQRLYSDSATNAPPTAQHLAQNTSNSVKAEQPEEPKYSLTFTCKVSECDERTSHMFSKRAYHHGIVIIQCPKCKNRCVPTKRTTVYSCFLNPRWMIQASHCGQPRVVQGRTDGPRQPAEYRRNHEVKGTGSDERTS